MKHTLDPAISRMEGKVALPRKNGELTFEAPWQGRAFGLAVALYHRGVFVWDEFRDRLIAEISSQDTKASEEDPGSAYYERWLSSLEKLLVEKGLLSREEVESRRAEIVSGKRAGNL